MTVTASSPTTPIQIKRHAVISGCLRYRYLLKRTWDRSMPTVLFVCLNPSTADAKRDDATARRCVRFALSWGFGSLEIVNLFALRSVTPSALKTAEDPVGPKNDWWLSSRSKKAQMTVIAWGASPLAISRVQSVLPMLGQVSHLGLTKDGYPRHPLYLPKNIQPQKF